MQFSSRRHSSRRTSARHFTGPRTSELLEPRLLMAVNNWQAGVSGTWSDYSRWSLGHVPMAGEDVVISVPGTYTVTQDIDATVRSVSVGGASGVQTLRVFAGNDLTVITSATVQDGDLLEIRPDAGVNVGGSVFDDGTIRIISTSVFDPSTNTDVAVRGLLYLQGSLVGSGEVIFDNNFTGSDGLLTGGGSSTIGAAITVGGKSGTITGFSTNYGMLLVSFRAETLTISDLTNQGVITAINGADLNLRDVRNAAGKTISIDGGPTFDGGSSLNFTGNWNNAGTIALNNSTVYFNGRYTGFGNLVLSNSAVFARGTYDLQNKPLHITAETAPWFDLTTFANVSSFTLASGVGLFDFGGRFAFDNVTLNSNLVLPANTGLTIFRSLVLNGSNRTITLAGENAVLNIYGSIDGAGQIVMEGRGATPDRRTTRISTVENEEFDPTIGAGITIRGGSALIDGSNNLTLFGTVLANVPGESITLLDLTNRGQVVAAPGRVKFERVDNRFAREIAVGIGGTTPGVSHGVLDWTIASSNPAATPTFSAVLINGYVPPIGSVFQVAKFDTIDGGFLNQKLEAGSGRKFTSVTGATDLKLTATAIALNFASVVGGAFVLNGTSRSDSISVGRPGGVLTAALNGNRMVFYSPLITSMTLNAGAGNDTVGASSSAGVTINGGDGNDYLTGGAGNDQIHGGLGNDRVDGFWGNDTLFGDSGNDLITGALGIDSLYGGNDNDTLDGGADADRLSGGNGLDTVTYATRFNSVTVTLDTLADDGGLNEHDYVLPDFETILGGAGNDRLTGNALSNLVRGGTGNDTIFGLDGNDTMYGDAGEDSLVGGTGDDSIGGSTGNDTIDAGNSVTGAGADVMSGGPGIDTVTYAARTENLYINIDNFADDGSASGSTVTGQWSNENDNPLRDIEVLVGGSGEDILIGSNDVVTTIRGGSGNDNITIYNNSSANAFYGDDGEDTIVGSADMFGGDGNDNLFVLDYFPDAGPNVYSGGNGVDTIRFGTSRALRISLDNVANDLVGTTPVNVLSDFETVIGGRGADLIVGNNADNVLLGGDSTDTLRGLGGNDTLVGQGDDDGGPDVLDGGSGVNVLVQ